METEKEIKVIEQKPQFVERLGAIACHASIFMGLSLIVPLVLVLCVNKDKNYFVYRHAKQAFVYQAVMIVSIMTGFAVWLLYAANLTGGYVVIAALLQALAGFAVVSLLFLVFVLVAIIKAALGKPYTYPFLGRFN